MAGGSFRFRSCQDLPKVFDRLANQHWIRSHKFVDFRSLNVFLLNESKLLAITELSSTKSERETKGQAQGFLFRASKRKITLPDSAKVKTLYFRVTCPPCERLDKRVKPSPGNVVDWLTSAGSSATSSPSDLEPNSMTISAGVYPGKFRPWPLQDSAISLLKSEIVLKHSWILHFRLQFGKVFKLVPHVLVKEIWIGTRRRTWVVTQMGLSRFRHAGMVMSEYILELARV